jgi:hypothetical protein
LFPTNIVILFAIPVLAIGLTGCGENSNIVTPKDLGETSTPLPIIPESTETPASTYKIPAPTDLPSNIVPTKSIESLAGLHTDCKTNADCINYIPYSVCHSFCINQDTENRELLAMIAVTCDPTQWKIPTGETCNCISGTCTTVAGEKESLTIQLCEIESPFYDYDEECQKYIDEKLPGQVCSFEMGGRIDWDFGSCANCTIKCE